MALGGLTGIFQGFLKGVFKRLLNAFKRLLQHLFKALAPLKITLECLRKLQQGFRASNGPRALMPIHALFWLCNASPSPSNTLYKNNFVACADIWAANIPPPKAPFLSLDQITLCGASCHRPVYDPQDHQRLAQMLVQATDLAAIVELLEEVLEKNKKHRDYHYQGCCKLQGLQRQTDLCCKSTWCGVGMPWDDWDCFATNRSTVQAL